LLGLGEQIDLPLCGTYIEVPMQVREAICRAQRQSWSVFPGDQTAATGDLAAGLVKVTRQGFHAAVAGYCRQATATQPGCRRHIGETPAATTWLP